MKVSTLSLPHSYADKSSRHENFPVIFYNERNIRVSVPRVFEREKRVTLPFGICLTVYLSVTHDTSGSHQPIFVTLLPYTTLVF